MSKVEIGQTVSVHYIGTLDDGTEFDSSRKNNEPLLCEVGGGKLIKGFDNALVGMTVGETKKVSLGPDQAYGNVISEAFQSIPKSSFPPDYKFKIGGTVQGQNEQGQAVRATIESLEEENVNLDFNHPMAGKNLNFEIELLEIQE
mgnify:CR=1 FL=1